MDIYLLIYVIGALNHIYHISILKKYYNIMTLIYFCEKVNIIFCEIINEENEYNNCNSQQFYFIAFIVFIKKFRKTKLCNYDSVI